MAMQQWQECSNAGMQECSNGDNFNNLIYLGMMIQNPFASPRVAREAYQYESSLLCGLRVGEMLAILERTCETCPCCQLRKKTHYCIEPHCRRKELICPQCDAGAIADPHYMHDRTYVLPLLSRDICNHFYRLKRRVTAYHLDIQEEIAKMEDYLTELRKVEALARARMRELEEEEESGRIRDYTERMEDFLAHLRPGDRLGSVLRDVQFKSAQECASREEEIRSEIIAHLNALRWPKDPQKVLKEKLLKPAPEEERKEVFISRRKALQLNEIDGAFRTSQQFYTQNLEGHLVEIKVEQDYLAKPKFYESFIHHFRNCSRLALDNAALAHLKTPLSFRRLRELEFTFTSDFEAQAVKIDTVSPQIAAVTFKRMREEDARVLKTIGCQCVELRKVHVEFSNKIDLFNYKELIDFLELLGRGSLVSFTLKVRTESEVKRLYGYLSKFYKEFSSDPALNLAESLLEVLDANRYLTRVVVEGVKPLSMAGVLGRLRGLSFLMDYKVYYENVDLMTEVDDREAKQLEDVCFKRKRVFYALAKASKQKRYPRNVVNRVVEDMLI